MKEDSLLHVIMRVCDRNGSHRFTWDQIKEEIQSLALQKGSYIENPDSAIMTASYDLSRMVGNVLLRTGRGEYEFLTRQVYKELKATLAE